MKSGLVWALSLALGVAATVLSARSGYSAHLVLTALPCLLFAAVGAIGTRRLAASGAGEARLASANASAMALVWAWATLSLLLIYVFVLYWHEWWQYVLGAGVIAILCLLFSMAMARDADAGREDKTLLKLARYLAVGQLVGMVLAMIGLVVDDKMPRDPKEPDWAANTIFFFGAAALAVISLIGLKTSPSRQS
jgi:hypothetical protein